MSPTEEQLIAAAKECNDCTGWVEHCKAKCCSYFSFRIAPDSFVEFSDDEVRIGLNLTPDLRRYYQLHGAQIQDIFLVVPRSSCEQVGERLIVNMRCFKLTDDNLCAIHENGQPEACKPSAVEMIADKDYLVLPECLASYKLKALEKEKTQ